MGLNYAQQKRFTAEASTFFTATGITDPTQKTAVDYLVKQLKANNLYAKFSALYPFVGGSADTHKFNLINPADSDAAFRIVWSGSVTHDANGIKSNGTNGYGDTKYNPVAASANPSSFSYGVYKTGTNASGTSRIYFGCQDAPNAKYNIMGWLNSGLTEVATISAQAIPTGYTPDYLTPNAQTSGIISICCNGSRNAQFWGNGSKIGAAKAQLATEFPNFPMFILAANSAGTPSAYSLNNIIKLAYVSTGLSDAEMATLHTIITAYQTLLGRD